MAKAKRKPEAAEAGEPRISRYNWPLIRQRVLVSLGALLLVGGIATMAILRPEVAAQVGKEREVEPSISMNWPKLYALDAGPGDTWLARQTQQELLGLAETALSGNPMDHASLVRCEALLMTTGWFSSIDRIARTPSGNISIKATWRQPVAAVRCDGLDWIVSEKTELMPLHYPPDMSRLPLVMKPTSPRPTKPGEVWIGGDVEAGLALLAYLKQHDEIMKQVRGVDVSGFAKSRQLAIITDRGNRIIWGTPTNAHTPGEPTTRKKIEWLLDMQASPRFGRRIDAGAAVIVLNNPAGVMIDKLAMTDDLESGLPPSDAELPGASQVTGPKETPPNGVSPKMGDNTPGTAPKPGPADPRRETEAGTIVQSPPVGGRIGGR